MKIRVLNTANGFLPIYSIDLEEKKKLKIGEEYEVEVKKIRNPKFHRKYFALINMAFHNLPENYVSSYPHIEVFRKAIQVMAGYCDISYTLEGEQLMTPQSIAFASMDEFKFSELYDKVLDILLRHVFLGANRDFVENEIVNFM